MKFHPVDAGANWADDHEHQVGNWSHEQLDQSERLRLSDRVGVWRLIDAVFGQRRGCGSARRAHFANDPKESCVVSCEKICTRCTKGGSGNRIISHERDPVRVKPVSIKLLRREREDKSGIYCVFFWLVGTRTKVILTDTDTTIGSS